MLLQTKHGGMERDIVDNIIYNLLKDKNKEVQKKKKSYVLDDRRAARKSSRWLIAEIIFPIESSESGCFESSLVSPKQSNFRSCGK